MDVTDRLCRLERLGLSGLDKLIAMQELLDDIHDEIRDHVRSLESRIEMSKKEEVAREAMIEWLEEEAGKIEWRVCELSASVRAEEKEKAGKGEEESKDSKDSKSN